MSCIQTGFTIQGDVNNKLSKAVKFVAGFDTSMETILAGYFGTPEFQSYIKQETGKDNPVEVNGNTLHKLLRLYFNDRHKDIKYNIAKKNAESLKGFSSANAVNIGRQHTSNLLLEVYENQYQLPKADKLTPSNMIRSVIKTINDNYNKDVVSPLMSRLKTEDPNGELVQKAIAMNSEIQTNLSDIKSLDTQFNLARSTNDIERGKLLAPQLKAKRDRNLELSRDLFVNLGLIVDKYGNIREKNYKALLTQVRGNPNEWFEEALNVSKITNLIHEFSVTLEQDKTLETNYSDELDIVNPNVDSKDEMSKSWEDTNYGSFERHVSTGLKLYLDKLYKLNSPTKIGDTTYDYDTNNELGVPVTMGSNFVLTQISNNADFSSKESFVSSIDKLARINPSVHGLSKLVNDMVADERWLNYVYVQTNTPKIAKSMAVINENGIDFQQSNRSADPLGHMIFNLINQVKSTYRERFTTKDLSDLERLRNKLPKVEASKTFLNSNGRKELDTFITDTIRKYFPNITKDSILSYLSSNNNNAVTLYSDMLQNIKVLLDNTSKVIDSYSIVQSEYNVKYKEWANRRSRAREFGEAFIEVAPVMDMSTIDFNKLDAPIINLSKKLYNHTIIRNELNSTNAEGNMSSDLIDNNYILNFIKTVNSSTTENPNAGLEKIKLDLERTKQYDYSPFFFGVRNTAGAIITPGLFSKDPITGKVAITDNAKSLINVTLFDGARDNVNSKSAMYSGMSKGDYFFTNMLAFNTPIKYAGKVNAKVPTAGFFMRTPSDAPKNFIVQYPKQDVKSLWNIDRNSVNQVFNNFKNQIAKDFNYNDPNVIDDTYNAFYKNNRLAKNNKVDAIEFYELLTNPIENKVYDKLYHKYDESTNKVRIPIMHSDILSEMTIWLEGDKAVNANVVTNLKITSYSSNAEENGNTIFPNEFVDKIIDRFEQDGIINGTISRNVNRYSSAYRALNMHLTGEVSNFVNNLNNVFHNVNGQWILKSSTDNLIDRYHYNGSLLAKNGKLTGNFASFIRLFQTGDSNPNQEIEQGLSLYGALTKANTEPAIISNDNGELMLNPNRTDLFKLTDDSVILNLNSETEEVINSVVDKWVNNYYKEIIARTEQYNTINDERYSIEDFVDYSINSAIMEMNFDDMFEGDSKFYKSAQDLLKRAKETQASGKVYSGGKVTDLMGAPITSILDSNGNKVEITIKNNPINVVRNINGKVVNENLTARNGFYGVTIRNVSRSSSQADNIRKELTSILSNKMSKDRANKIANQISSGYFAETDVDDAMSYITIEEFIARRHSDGTISQYEDLLEQLLDDNVSVEDIDLNNFDARIQVQKNFYYDKQLDTATGVVYPRQIKNSEFVLIPKLIKGTSLETLYNIMSNNDINQVNTIETSKAAKKNVLTFWNNDGTTNPSEFENAIQSNHSQVAERYYYQYLYKQQDIVDHMVDETNKAGIQIMKKLIDNTSPEVQPYINNFFSAYVANIKEDFNILINTMGWKVENDTLVNADQVDGNTSLKFTEFYKKARVEAQRLGMDSNFIEFLTPDEFGNPSMPNYMNNVSSKLESIAQSIFNNGVTRQTLPGWHAPQITSVGYASSVKDENGITRTLKYHPAVEVDGVIIQEAYAEIMIPRWSNLIPKGYDLSKLESEGLDIQLGYRIPTEGKQSVSILKVVGFLDDTYGSTVVVPDEWVTQTGSDFDIDSVYAITYEMYKNRQGEVKKVTLDESTEQKDVERRYINYVNSTSKAKIRANLIEDSFRRDEVAKFRESLTSETSRAESKYYKELLKQSSDVFAKLDNQGKKFVRDFNNLNKNNDLVDRYQTLSDQFTEFAKDAPEEIANVYNEFAEINEALAYTLNLSRETNKQIEDEFHAGIKGVIANLYEQNRLEYLGRVKVVAEGLGLLSYDEFANQSILEQNTRSARNNFLLDSMINIMNHPNSREENYSRSNFDDLSGAMKVMDNLRGASSIKRSTYNPLDQIDFMENAMSGAMLKALSVTRDNFNSVNNYVKSYLSPTNAIQVEYDLDETVKTIVNGNVVELTDNKGNTSKKYDYASIVESYGEENVTKSNDGRTVTVNHNKMAWSNNNRNVIGKLVTTYSSQTTAHILDAVKEGTIYNENDFTFGTFKTLIDLGIDYDTAVAYLMQPGITEIVQAHFETKSIYINTNANLIDLAVKRVAQRLGITVNGLPITDYTPISIVNRVLSMNGDIQNAYSDLFSLNVDDRNSFNIYNVPLNGIMLQKRLKGVELANIVNYESTSIDFRNGAFDLAMIINFSKFNKTTKNLEANARVSNPDKFGAKVDVRSTRRIIEEITEYSSNPTSEVGRTILVDDKPLTAALYPGINTGSGIIVEESKYPYLAAFIKYATIPSVTANSELFPTESFRFNEVTNTVQSKLNLYFNPEQYKEFKQYMISNVYASIPLLTTPATVNKYGHITVDNTAVENITKNNEVYWDSERSRIMGYKETQSINLTVKDINTFDEADIENFNKLTPAQKVQWVQYNFVDGSGVFQYLNVNTFNQMEYKDKGFSSQTIKFSDKVDNIEDIFVAFKNSFFHKSPYVRLATLDLIKYSFINEGFRFKKSSISKIITNDSMYLSIEAQGTNIIDAINRQFYVYSDVRTDANKNFIDRYIRSHSEIVKEINIPRPKTKNIGKTDLGRKVNSLFNADNLGFIPFNEDMNDVITLIDVQAESPREYVRLSKVVNKKKTTTLFKTYYGNHGIYLVPLNLLDRNETFDNSVNPNNNKYPTIEYYESLIGVLDTSSLTTIERDKYLVDLTSTKEKFTIKPIETKRQISSLTDRNDFIRILNNGTEREQYEIANVVKTITDHFESPVEEATQYSVLRNDSAYLAKVIPANEVVIQNIPMENYTATVAISRFTNRNGKDNNINWVIKGDDRGDITKVSVEALNAVRNSLDAGSKNPNLYRFEVYVDPEVKNDTSNKEYNDSDIQLSSINELIPEDISETFNYTDTDKVAKSIFNHIHRRSVSSKDIAAKGFTKTMDIVGVDRFSAESIHDNSKNLYSAAADYFRIQSGELENLIKNFKVGENTYSINNPELYKQLRDHPESYPLLVDLVLQAKTFGGTFYDIFNIEITSLDPETANSIESIKKSINSIRDSVEVKSAINLIFNDYLANNYSTNPNVRNGLIELTTSFGDTDWLDLHFEDIGNVDNKQVQVIVKYVNSILNTAIKINAPVAVRNFTSAYDEIINRPGDYNVDNFITKDGRLVRPYTDKFIEDRDKFYNKLKDLEDTYTRQSVQYVTASLERDKWRLDNMEQEVITQYYKDRINLVETVMNRAPELYVEYLQLTNQLYDSKEIDSLTPKEASDRRRLINDKIANLHATFYKDGNMKEYEDYHQAQALRKFITDSRELKKKYYNNEETTGFKSIVKKYKAILENYQKANPYQNIEDRLNDPQYREAYDWLKDNTRYTLNEEANKVVQEAFKTLKAEDNINSSKLKKILTDADAYDAFGNVDARKLTDFDIARIKTLTEHKYAWAYDSLVGEAVLISEAPSNLPVFTDQFYRALRGNDSNGSDNPAKLKIIGEINKLLLVGVDKNTGAISSKELFDNLSEEQLKELAGLYMDLRNTKSKNNRSDDSLATFNANVGFAKNTQAFNREWAYAQTNLKGTKYMNLWLNIFADRNKDGEFIVKKGAYQPNDSIYGYIVPIGYSHNDPGSNRFINAEKTKARNVVENDLLFTPNEYYYDAMNKATSNGEYDKWFADNHTFNPYTHKYEPLKVWTNMEINPAGNLKGTFDYTATYENTNSTVKGEYANPNYEKGSVNYNSKTGNYNSKTNMSPKEADMYELLQSTINNYASTHSMRKFAGKGFLPRRATYTPDAKWYGKQVMGSLGLEFRNTGERQWTDTVDYLNDFDADFDMMSLIRQKGYKEPIKIVPQGTTESDEDYTKRVEDIKAQNKEIEAENLKLDNEVLDRDWKSVFQDFITKATDYNARQQVKGSMYLLLEDLKERPTYKRSKFSGDLKRDKDRSVSEQDSFQTTNQKNTYEIANNWTRRVLFNQFKKTSPYSKWADLAQNITSAKYMIANVTGGIANIGTGMVNVMGEFFANNYFGKHEFGKAQLQYRNNITSFLKDMYSDTSNNMTVAVAKLMDVVDFDAITERRPNEKASERVKRVRDGLYALQSGGEHYMQTSVMMAMMKSHRIFRDSDGDMRVGSLDNYIWNVELETLMGMLNGKEDLLQSYINFIKTVKNDTNELRKYDNFSRNINQEFLRNLGDKDLIKQYISERDKAVKDAKTKFEQNPVVDDQFEIIDGLAYIKQDSPLTATMFGEFRNKVIYANKKIHGSYDKVGAALIEREWWGGLVMQYHKHIYPGIMKRYRRKGYYNESRSSVEVGSYNTLATFLSMEFRGISERIKNRQENNQENIALASIQEVIKASVETVLNLKLNYSTMPIWEQNNLKRVMGDLLGITGAFLLAIGIHAATDDDDIKDSESLATLLYMADRINSETVMYAPWGLYSEAQTLWSSPIAAQNGPKDLIKGLGIVTQSLFDEDYNAYYTTGLYKDQHKGAVLLYRNTPIYRVAQRLSTMTKNNNYYRINENALNIKYAKMIADDINPD